MQYIVLCCVVLSCGVLCFIVMIILYCVAYSARESKSPAVSNTCKACLVGFAWEIKAPGDGLLVEHLVVFFPADFWDVTQRCVTSQKKRLRRRLLF